MFGLDEWISHASDGTTLVLVLAVAVLLGLRHATDPDHLVAVATLVAADQSATARQAGRLGASWGLGHATSLLALGLPIVLLGASLPEGVEQVAESAIGLTIVALATWLLVRWRRGLLQGGPPPTRRPAPTAADPDAHYGAPARTPRQAYAIGFLHGVGGSAGVGVLLLAGIGNHALAILALALFALCTAISMMLLSTGFGFTLGSAPAQRLLAGLAPILGVGSLVFGAWYALGPALG
jgi:high-affinity nickel permease